jgi:hypothetical protein
MRTAPESVLGAATRDVTARRDTRRRVLAGLSAVVVALLTASAPASAQAHATYVPCDNAASPDYARLVAAPASCNVGLRQSMYELQPVPGKPFAARALRNLHWRYWGRYMAEARGLACKVTSAGAAEWKHCSHVVVRVYHPEKIMPAGGAYIYQLIVVRHVYSKAEPYRWAYWYQPGTDY